uniref:Uncharacterized protein n=1 Tax=Curvibacter symbiont subsp. Hydra magnipapillata TaxID=667019 RepID=C9Y955_CURXX|nr:hypothetical protein Csp_A06560 [Curvibacter putative symbiont of Hydra magnipapillata]
MTKSEILTTLLQIRQSLYLREDCLIERKDELDKGLMLKVEHLILRLQIDLRIKAM